MRHCNKRMYMIIYNRISSVKVTLNMLYTYTCIHIYIELHWIALHCNILHHFHNAYCIGTLRSYLANCFVASVVYLS